MAEEEDAALLLTEVEPLWAASSGHLGMVAERVSCRLLVRDVKLLERERATGERGMPSTALLGELALLLGVRGSLQLSIIQTQISLRRSWAASQKDYSSLATVSDANLTATANCLTEHHRACDEVRRKLVEMSMTGKTWAS